MSGLESERLLVEVKAARRAFITAEAAYHAALLTEFNFKEGDVLENAKGVRAKVNRVFIRYGMPTWTAVLPEADGSWGKREIHQHSIGWFPIPTVVEHAA